MDRISIKDLEVYAKHGVFPEENALGQKFLINADIYMDLWTAGHRDEIGHSVHYGEVCEYITEYMTTHTVKLIETVAENIAAGILEMKNVKMVSVEVKKPWAPIGLHVESVSVFIQRKWNSVYLSIGSNIGDRNKYLNDALKSIEDTEGIRVEKVSSFIETLPYGKTDQPPFLNAAIKLLTYLPPMILLERLHEIENKAGRIREERWGPRTLDLDILLYEDEVICEEELIIPHADMENREFVLRPMAQIAPNLKHPVSGLSISQMLRMLERR